MKQHILVIEDELSLSQALCDNLELCGFSVEAAFDGEDALERVHKRIPSLILTDLLIPKIDGFDVISQIKKNDLFKDVPIIVLSNLDGIDAKIRVMSMGVNHYLIKSENSLLKIMNLVRECIGSTEKALDLTK